MRIRSVPPVLLAAWLMACGPGDPGSRAESGPMEQEDPEAGPVVAAVEAVLAGITAADPERVAGVVLPGAQVGSVWPGEGLRVITGEELVQGISDPEQGYVERMWDPVVQVQGPVATVWTPYDFYIHGSFSHCGVDTFQLVQVDGSWRVQSLVYSVLQPPACELHPDGPPPG